MEKKIKIKNKLDVSKLETDQSYICNGGRNVSSEKINKKNRSIDHFRVSTPVGNKNKRMEEYLHTNFAKLNYNQIANMTKAKLINRDNSFVNYIKHSRNITENNSNKLKQNSANVSNIYSINHKSANNSYLTKEDEFTERTMEKIKVWVL
jgi:hypothetical protein